MKQDLRKPRYRIGSRGKEETIAAKKKIFTLPKFCVYKNNFNFPIKQSSSDCNLFKLNGIYSEIYSP